MWGMAYMDLYLWVYDLEDGKAIERIDLSRRERLPIQDMEMSDSQLRAHFRELAKKRSTGKKTARDVL